MAVPKSNDVKEPCGSLKSLGQVHGQRPGSLGAKTGWWNRIGERRGAPGGELRIQSWQGSWGVWGKYGEGFVCSEESSHRTLALGGGSVTGDDS